MNVLLAVLASGSLTSSTTLSVVNHKNIENQLNTVNQESILIGYWHNFDDATGYQGGNADYIDLKDVSDEYDVINVSFMKVFEGYGDIPTFIPLVPNHPEMNQQQKDEYFKAEIDYLHSKGKKVVLSLGGADAHINLKLSQKDEFINETRRIVDKYGFDGIDIDLEQQAINAADNVEVITSSLIQLKNEYESEGKDFIISMAPEFPYLRLNSPWGSYVPYLTKLEGYYDYVSPQFYNQGGDGINVLPEDQEELGINIWWLPQNNKELKPEFLYLITKYITEGKDNFYQIDADKLVIGLPANDDAAATGQVQSGDIKEATQYLSDKDIYLKGLMTWSVNWDINTDWDFANYYSSEFYM